MEDWLSATGNSPEFAKGNEYAALSFDDVHSLSDHSGAGRVNSVATDGANREESAETRTIAEEMHDRLTRRMMQGIVAGYEQLAERTEKLERDKGLD